MLINEKFISPTDYILEGCKKKKVSEEVDFSDVDSAFEVDFDTTLGDIELHEGDIVEIDSVNFADEVVYVDIYTADDGVEYKNVEVSFDDIVEFSENHSSVQVIDDEDGTLDDEDIVDLPIEEEVAPLGVALLGESNYKIKGGKKVKVDKALQKKRDQLKASGQNKKFKIDKEGKKVRKSKEEIKAEKAAGKRMAKNADKYAKKRVKSLKKSLKMNEEAYLTGGKDFVGVPWSDIDFKERSRFLKNAECIPVNGEDMVDGDSCWVVSEEYPDMAVEGTYIEDGIPEIEDDAVVYDSDVTEACGKKKMNEGCLEEYYDLTDPDTIFNFETSFTVDSDTTLGNARLYAGETVNITEIDFKDKEVSFEVYDENGNLIDDDFEATFSEIYTFSEENEYAYNDIEEVAPLGVALLGEAKYKIRGGKKVKVNQALQKKRDKLKASGQNKRFKIDSKGRKVKKSAQEIKAEKKAGKRMAKNSGKYKSKRARSQKMARRLAESAFSFTDATDSTLVSVHEGDYVIIDEGLFSLVREGEVLLEGVEVEDEMLEELEDNGYVSDEDAEYEEVFPEDDEDELEDDEIDDTMEGCSKKEKIEEANLLTHTSEDGYLLIREGTEIPLGNRVRARNMLSKYGYEVDKDMLDEAFEGAFVAL